MKKILTLLAVATIPATLGGCAACCPTGLCPCCPCNWFNRTPAACPPTYAAPLVAAPAACPPTYAPGVAPQYVTPLAAPYAAAPCAPACATWNPCQGVVMSQPTMAQQAVPYGPPQQAMGQPMMHPAQPAYYAEPGCGYVESSCGGPMTGMVSYGPEMPVEYGPCDSGCCDPGVANPPVPEPYIDPRPMAE
jgi:hypothetical protein